MDARQVLDMCRMFGCLPSQLMDEDADLIRMLNIERRAGVDGE